MADEWKSYTKAVKSWGNSHKDLVQKLEKDCSSGQKVPDLTKCSGGPKAVAEGAGILSCVIVGSLITAVIMFL